MKNYKLCYVTGGYIVELIASSPEEKITEFLDELSYIKFEDYKDQCYRYSVDKEVDDSDVKELKNSDDIRKEFNKILSEEIIDLGSFWDLVVLRSPLANVKLEEFITKFLNMFEYQVYFSYDQREFGRFSRAIMLLGARSEINEFHMLTETFSKNTKLIRLFHGKELATKDAVEKKNKVYKHTVDKEMNK